MMTYVLPLDYFVYSKHFDIESDHGSAQAKYRILCTTRRISRETSFRPSDMDTLVVNKAVFDSLQLNDHIQLIIEKVT